MRTAVDHLRHLLQTREELLARLSEAYGGAEQAGARIDPGHRLWEDHWEDAVPRRGAVEEEWSEDE